MEWFKFFFADTLHIPTGPSWTDPDDTPSWFWDSISDAINSAISGLLQALFTPFNLIGTALDRIGEGISYIGNSIWSFFSEPLTDIWHSIQALPSAIVSGVREVLTFIFVPNEEYFASKFDEIQSNFVNKLEVDTSDLEKLKNVPEINLNNLSEFQGTIYGKRVKFVDFTFLNQYKSTFHNLVRGFIFPLLILYNMNQIYFLIRGVNLFGKSKGDD